GIDILQVFNKGPEEIARLRDRFKELGGGISDKAIDKLFKLSRAQKELDTATNKLKGELAGALAPALTFLAEKFADGVAWFQRMADKSNIVVVAAGVVGAALVAAVIASYGAWLPWIAAIVAAIVVIEDLYTTIKGGRSANTVTNYLIDQVLQVGQDFAEAW